MRVRCRLLLLLLVFFTLVSFSINTTFGWNSGNQQALNQTQGTSNLVDVELIKLEKTLDGQLTNIPISDVIFYLYKADGTQVGGQHQTDANGIIRVNLPKGEYYFEEYSPGPSHTFDQENGVLKKRYPFTITGEERDVVIVKAYNVPLQGSLTIKKTALYEDGTPLEEPDTNMRFAFRVTFSDNGRYAYRINGGEEQFLSSGETLYLKHGEQAVFSSLPVGVLYTVIEESSPFYTTMSSGHQGNITVDGCVASFTNYMKKQYGSLRVLKEGKGNLADQEFLFEIEMNGETQTFPLKVGEYKDFSFLPLGTKYIVKEIVQVDGNYTASIIRYEGTISSEQMTVLPFLNIENVENPTNGNLEVKKDVRGQVIDPDKEFIFEITFEGNGAPQSPQRFALKASQTKVFSNIPHGVKYCIREIDAGGYIPYQEAICGTIISNETKVVTFINEVVEEETQKGILEIRKEVTGNPPMNDLDKEFRVKLIVDGVETIFTLKAGEKKVFELPVNSDYEVSEDNYYGDGYSQSIVNGAGTIYPGVTEVVIRNDYIKKELVVIEGEKTWELNGYTDVLPEFIRVRLYQGDRLIQEEVVKADENGLWKYQFQVLAFDDEGNKIEYRVEEVPLDHFKVEYDGYNIKNIYRVPITLQLPIMRKEVVGEKAPNQYFSFLMEGKQGAPMPAGSQGNKKMYHVRGNEEVSIGDIVYEKPGIYVYTIQEINEGIPGWKYDDSIYELTVEVVEQEGQLVANTRITKNQIESNAIVFTNIYEEDTADNHLYVEGKKQWNHGNNPNPPKEIIVQLYGDGELLHQKRVTEADDWGYIFEVKKYAEDGHEIVYVIQEVPVNGYDAVVDGYNIINTYRGDNPGGNGSNIGNSASTGDATWKLLWMYGITMGMSGAIAWVLYRKRRKT